MYRLDLHTHSIASPDGGLSAADYGAMLRGGGLQTIAVTDHDRIDFALSLRDTLGEAVIVGEEIRAKEGEIIGLYLRHRIRPGMSAAATVQAIRRQDGLVYVPHPFESVRQGLDEATLLNIAADVDIIETRNGRAVFQDKGALARQYHVRHGWAAAAASDAHGAAGWGRTYSTVTDLPTRDTLVSLLLGAQHTRRHPGLRGLAAPKLNRLRKRLGRA